MRLVQGGECPTVLDGACGAAVTGVGAGRRERFGEGCGERGRWGDAADVASAADAHMSVGMT